MAPTVLIFVFFLVELDVPLSQVVILFLNLLSISLAVSQLANLRLEFGYELVFVRSVSVVQFLCASV